jgi:drug/metabolite transporter (DMT)-like permease
MGGGAGADDGGPRKSPLGLELSEDSLKIWRWAVILTFMGLNISLNFYNSWLMSAQYETVNVTNAENVTVEEEVQIVGPVDGHPNIDFPVFYTMWHMFAGVIGSSVLLLTVAKPSTGFPRPSQFWQYGWQLLLIASCTAGNTACNNASLQYVSLFLNQVIKASTPMVTMIFSFLIERKKYSLGLVLSCCAIVAGTIVASLKGGDEDSPSTTLGIILASISLFCAGLRPVIMSITMKPTPDRPELPPTAVLWYDNFLAFWMMVIFWSCSPERDKTIDYFNNGGGGEEVGLIAGGATLAFCFNLT